MEDKPTTAAVPTTILGGNAMDATLPTTGENGKKPKTKKRGAFTIIKAAIFMMRLRQNGKSKPICVEVASNGMLNKLVGSIRPLQLQDNQSSPAPPELKAPEEVPSPPSPQQSSSCGGSVDGLSQYDSATSLQDLDKESESQYGSATNLKGLGKYGETDDDDESDDGLNNHGGDEMIDAKADEFIAQFYQQMRLQQLKSEERYNKIKARQMQKVVE